MAATEAAIAPLEPDLLEALFLWLQAERDEAKRVRAAEDPHDLREWDLDRYANRIERAKRKRECDMADELKRHTARKLAAAPELPPAITLGCRRAAGEERISQDEANRRAWAAKALEIITRNGWLGDEPHAAEAEQERLQTRLLRGLRMRTLGQRVHSLERMQRSCLASLAVPWFRSTEDVED